MFMLQDIKELYGYKVAAVDGVIGTVKDFYFDHANWAIRYVVVDLGPPPGGREILLATQALGKLDPYEKTLHVKLAKKQIETCPEFDSHQPISRNYERECHRHYGSPPYWEREVHPASGTAPAGSARKEKLMAQPPSGSHDNAHLQRTQALVGYQVQADKGVIGALRGFTVFDRSWFIRDLIVETGNWFSGDHVRMSPDQIKHVDHAASCVHVNLAKTDMEWTAGKHLTQAWAGTRGG